MSNIRIQKIYVSTDAQLRVKVAESKSNNYALIYRAAMSVRWDEDTHMLSVLPTARLQPQQQFQQIVKAVQDEYGDQLVVDESTDMSDVPPNLADAIRAIAM